MVEGQVEVLGTGKAEVFLNGKPAIIDASGGFKSNIPLSVGRNSVTITVFVDKHKTNSRTIDIIRTDSGGTDPNSGGSNPSSGSGAVSQQPATTNKIERMSIAYRQDRDGRQVTAAKVNLAPMQEEIEQFKKQASSLSNPILKYSIASVQDVLEISIPVLGVVQAAEELPQSSIAIESPQGVLKLPLHAMKTALTGISNQKSGELQIRIGTLLQEQDRALQQRLLQDGSKKIGAALEIGLVVKEGEEEKAIAFKGERAEYRFKLPAIAADRNRMTVIDYDGKSGRYAFIPALFESREGDLEVLLKLSETGIYGTVEVQPPMFTDIQGHWAEQDILLLASKLIVKGTSDTRFSPGETLTRAQFTAMLVRALGMKEKAGVMPFVDVQSQDWYAGAIGEAVEQGLIQATDSSHFSPNALLTREHMSVLILRAAEIAEVKDTAVNTEAVLQSFRDQNEIAAWSKDAVAAVVSKGLMEGRNANSFVPNGTATRAEGVVALKRLLQQSVYINR